MFLPLLVWSHESTDTAWQTCRDKCCFTEQVKDKHPYCSWLTVKPEEKCSIQKPVIYTILNNPPLLYETTVIWNIYAFKKKKSVLTWQISRFSHEEHKLLLLVDSISHQEVIRTMLWLGLLYSSLKSCSCSHLDDKWILENSA